MAHNYVVFGCGMQAQAIVHDLLTHDPEADVRICDVYQNRIDSLYLRYASHHGARLRGMRLAVTDADPTSLDKAMEGRDVAISAVPYHLNPVLTKAAVRNRVSLCDLGGNIDVVKGQFALDEDARRAGIALVPDCGIAPGAVSIFAKRAIDLLREESIDYLRIRVGGLPQNPTNPLGYAHAFNVEGLVNEYVEPVEVLRNGAPALAEPMGDVETLDFAGLGWLEAAYTSGGSSTLAATYEGRVQELNYKTLRYPGHWATMRDWRRRGLFTSIPAIWGTGGDGAHHWLPTLRDAVETVLAAALPTGRDDLMAVRVDAGKGSARVRIEFVDRYDETNDHTAMMRTTGFSIAIVAQMIASGRYDIGRGIGCGTFRQEQLPADAFINAWTQRGLPYSERVTFDG